MDSFYTRRNDDEECWEVMERAAIWHDGMSEDGVIARFYDGNRYHSALADWITGQLNAGVMKEN